MHHFANLQEEARSYKYSSLDPQQDHRKPSSGRGNHIWRQAEDNASSQSKATMLLRLQETGSILVSNVVFSLQKKRCERA